MAPSRWKILLIHLNVAFGYETFQHIEKIRNYTLAIKLARSLKFPKFVTNEPRVCNE